MRLNGLEFALRELGNLTEGVCPACRQRLSEQRDFTFTCDAICHRLWVDRLVLQFGETRTIVDSETGKAYAVPTRDILERGVTPRDLLRYPEVTKP